MRSLNMNLVRSGKNLLSIAAATLITSCDVLGDGYVGGRPLIPGSEGQKEVQVQVMDATTMKPIAGAIVLGCYYGQAVSTIGGGGGVVCGKSESGVTDENGLATLPNDEDKRTGNLSGPHLESAYKRGYQMAKDIYIVTKESRNKWLIKQMKPKPYGETYALDDVVSTHVFSGDRGAMMLETKLSTRIYLMPSTAKTKEERLEELNWMGYRGGGASFSCPLNLLNQKAGLLL